MRNFTDGLYLRPTHFICWSHTGRIRGEGTQGTGLAYILAFYTVPRILVTKGLPSPPAARPWRSFDTPKVLPFCSAKHSGVNPPDAGQRPPERGAICNPTTYENVSKQGFLRAKCWFGLTFQCVLRR